MDISRYRKKKGIDEKAWADWLSDDMPASGTPAPHAGNSSAQSRHQAVSTLPRPAAVPRAPASTTSSPRLNRPVTPQLSVPGAVSSNQPTRLITPASIVPRSLQQPATKAVHLQPARPQRPITPVNTMNASKQAPEPALPWPQPNAHKTVVKPAADAPQATVSISIQIPSFDRKKLVATIRKRRQAIQAVVVHNKKRVVIVSGVCALVILGLFAPPLFKFGRSLVTNQPSTAPAAAKLGYAKPPFDVVVPSTEPNLATPDGTHSAYDAQRQTYSFIDSIGGKQITVSQQQIPAGQTAATLVPKAAKSFNATNPITTGWGTAYIETNQKYNSQIVVFSVKGQLMFIQSGFTVPNSQWITYINALN